MQIKKLTQIQHILLKSEMYIGSKNIETTNMWIIDNNNIIYQKIINYIPGLYKIFDEAIVNTYDQSIIDKSLNIIKIEIDKKQNLISVYNNGLGIPIEIHKDEKIYIPELIFSTLLTSSHYDEVIRTSGGTFGLGIKLTAIFSKYFKVEIGDPKNKKKYTQIYENNLSKINKPVIENYNKNNGYVKIIFKPDLELFKIDNLSDDMISLFKRRTFDISALTNKNVSVYFNNEKILIKNFYQYVLLFKFDNNKNINNKKENINNKNLDNKNIININCDERWNIFISQNNYEFNQISFVNSIYTSNGGKHVDYIISQIILGIKNKINNKFKFYNIKDSFIKNQINIFISCIIENPEFNSQTKEELITPINKFGSTCEISEKIINKIYNLLEIEEKIKLEINISEKKDLDKINIKKKSGIKAINKLHDATFAGTKKSNLCTLILTEGDSAKTMAISGISGITNINALDYYGIFPLKGKLLNVRDATHKQIINNEEFRNIKMILGLQMNTEYNINNINELRYGNIILFFDADVDGSHIKGLFINMINYFWPSLLHINGFIKIFITPMIKAINNNIIYQFYTFGDYEKWKKDNKNNLSNKTWTIKYYKGLGTNTTLEAKEYFKNLQKNLLNLNWKNDLDDEAIKLAFEKDKIENRKLWLKNYNKDNILDYSKSNITFYDFINKELIHFSNYDNIRSIPNIMDGLKPVQRKVIYAAFKKNLVNDIKVAQFVGYVSENTSYHHGENSLSKTIINMAQNFVGSNNINLLIPNGQFGTRLMGGKDASSPRYIYTCLDDLTRYIFNKLDDDLLNYLNDDGFLIEPEYYMPIIPMILINGTEGIGTGYSTFIPKFNPFDIIDILINLINKSKIKYKSLKPWYKGFLGTIDKLEDNIYYTKGLYTINNNKLIISELPLFSWTENYKEFLDDLVVNNKISNYKNNSTESIVEFIITLKDFDEEDLKIDNNGFNGIEKKFGLISKINLNNMHLYDSNNVIKKYNNVKQILEEFYKTRLIFYEKRKKILISNLQNSLNIIESKIKFINMVINKKINLLNIPKTDLINILKKKKLYLLLDEPPFDYLIKLPFYIFTKEKIDELHNDFINKNKLLKQIINKSIENMYMDDLIILKDLIIKKFNKK